MNYVIKRDGQRVPYNPSKILNAFTKAAYDAGEELTEENVDIILDNIYQEIKDKEVDIEKISDLVEDNLIKCGYVSSAKSYIKYRYKRSQERATDPEYKLLSKKFLSKYKHLPSPMGQLGSFVYYRTYSRYLTDKKRREYWWETCARAVDYNCSLQPSTTVAEAEELFDNMFNLRQFLAGRTLWSGGTPTAYTNPISQLNCSGVVIDNFDVFKDICYLLMLGVGVGFSVEKKHIVKLPKVRGNIDVIHKAYNAVPKSARKEVTEYTINGDVMEIIVGDSKLGWANSIDLLLKVFYAIDFADINFIVFNYNNVRPHGEPLKTFGGTASGHGALQIILEKMTKVLLQDNKGYKKLRPIEAMDLSNIIAEGIVVGGVRRSAQMVFVDEDDQETINAKQNIYIQNEKGQWVANQDILHRMMSNNSIAYYSKPTMESLRQRFEIIRYSAEGNFYNMEAAQKRKSNMKISNP